MKNLLLLFIGVMLVLVGLGVGCGYVGYQGINNILHNSLKIENWEFKITSWCFNGLPFVDMLDQLLNNKTYVVVLQNNQELRSTGGFMGSYAAITTKPTGIAAITIQDIYVPDGQLVGHIDPPIPIQQAFGQGWWKLRDSNWDPDFKIAAEQMAWFFEQGKQPADGIIAINLSLVNQILEILGEINPADYSEKVTSKTFYNLAQKYAETNFFPGSTQKRDFLSAVGNALLTRIFQSTPIERGKLAKLLWQNLKRREVMVWFKDASLQQVVDVRDWSGVLRKYTDNYLYIVETNLGANKANCCIDRAVDHKIAGDTQTLTIKYTNRNAFSNPKPPAFWGGNYINYLRVIIPAGSEVQGVKAMPAGRQVAEKELIKVDKLVWQYGLQEDVYTIEVRDQYQIVGFWAVVPAGQSLVAEIKYHGSIGKSLVVQKQPGIEELPYKLVVNGTLIISKDIDKTTELMW